MSSTIASQFPKRLYLQLDNCASQNKNKTVFTLASVLAKSGLFEEVQASIVPFLNPFTRQDLVCI